MDAIALLKADHRKVEGLFEKFESAKGAAKKQALTQEICTELQVHTAVEEEIDERGLRRARRCQGHHRRNYAAPIRTIASMTPR